jgi:spore maturation protein CgeB
MKILYVGQTNQGGTCRDRLNSLARLGHEVTNFDISQHQARTRILRSIQWRWSPRLLTRQLNRDLQGAVASGRLFDLVWIDKGLWVFPETVQCLKRRTAHVVHYTPDAQILSNRSPHFLRSIQQYTQLVTTKSFEVNLYYRHGAKSVTLVTQSFCPTRYAKPTPMEAAAADVGFVGDFKPNYGTVISDLSSAGFEVAVWGHRWRRAAALRRVPSKAVRGSGLWQEAYVNALASFRIGLGLLSKRIPEQHTTRTLEIPAAGTFLLAERTNEHTQMFAEGREAEFFSCTEELVAKARFYLEHDSSRRDLAQRGYERCWRSGYDNDSVLRRVLAELA